MQQRSVLCLLWITGERVNIHSSIVNMGVNQNNVAICATFRHNSIIIASNTSLIAPFIGKCSQSAVLIRFSCTVAHKKCTYRNLQEFIQCVDDTSNPITQHPPYVNNVWTCIFPCWSHFARHLAPVTGRPWQFAWHTCNDKLPHSPFFNFRFSSSQWGASEEKWLPSPKSRDYGISLSIWHARFIAMRSLPGSCTAPSPHRCIMESTSLCSPFVLSKHMKIALSTYLGSLSHWGKKKLCMKPNYSGSAWTGSRRSWMGALLT